MARLDIFLQAYTGNVPAIHGQVGTGRLVTLKLLNALLYIP